MIRAIIFDLDGTLVPSEKLRAQAYAIAVQRLRGSQNPTKKLSKRIEKQWVRSKTWPRATS